LIDLSAPLGDLLDDAPPEWASIPFWRLLNHTSGITMIVNRSEFEQIDADPASTNADIYQVVRQFPLEYGQDDEDHEDDGAGLLDRILLVLAGLSFLWLAGGAVLALVR
jgi:CubicO group peptidase (beta-lactamase class C family)